MYVRTYVLMYIRNVLIGTIWCHFHNAYVEWPHNWQYYAIRWLIPWLMVPCSRVNDTMIDGPGCQVDDPMIDGLAIRSCKCSHDWWTPVDCMIEGPVLSGGWFHNWWFHTVGGWSHDWWLCAVRCLISWFVVLCCQLVVPILK